MSNETIFYDIPAKDGHAWSINPWKTRLVLNFKGIPYTTQWVEFPDIPATLSATGLTPNPKDAMFSYSIPAIKHNNTYTMTSEAIAPVLEAAHPSPPLHIDDPMTAKVDSWVGEVLGPMRLQFLTRVPALLNQKSYDYFMEDRSKRIGRPMTELKAEVDSGAGAEEGWATVTPAIEKMLGWLREKEGPFLGGKEPIYADFLLVSAMKFFEKLSKEKLFDRLVSYGKEFEEVYAASAKWFEKDT